MRKGAVWGCTVLLLVLIGLSAAADDLVKRRAIVIGSDYEFTVENGVCSGEGTLDDPYIIEGYKIDAGHDDYGIRVHGTSRAFVIRNVRISGATKSAVYLSYVRNAVIEDCIFEGNWVGLTLNFSLLNQITRSVFSNNTDGIRLYFSTANQIRANSFDRNDTAIWLDASNENDLFDNLIAGSHMGVYLNLGSEDNTILHNAFVDNLHNARADDPNRWDDGLSGNYWCKFVALDVDENGIWDSPYLISSDGTQDSFPMVTHPLVPTSPPATCAP